MRRVVSVVVVAMGALLALASPAGAHPLGNFTVNTAAELRIAPDHVAIEHVVDFAEIPAFQASDDIDAVGEDAWASQECDDIAADQALTVAGEGVALHAVAARISFPPGQAGLSTIRLECSLRTEALDHVADVALVDHAFEHKTGWREITAVGDGATITSSDVPAESPTAHLTSYPSGAPRVVRHATVAVVDGGAAAPVTRAERASSLLPRGADGFSRSFTSLVSSKRVTVPFVLVALLAAAVLGAMHAVAPGHGKTVMAAYVVGRRGTVRQGLLIGATVAVTHTAGVLALGTGLWVSEAVAPERLIPVLGIVSGGLLAIIGTGLLRRALRSRGLPPTGHVHHHHDDHDHGHHHHHEHDHHHHHEHEHDDAPPRRSALVLLGLAGGMVPSPSALVVLLGALALGRAWLGVALVLAYGVGMACCLVGAGLLLARAGAALERRLAGSRAGGIVFGRALPAGTASIVVLAGVVLAVRAAAQL